MGATFVSRDWSEAKPEESPRYDSHSMGIALLNPLRGWKAFHVTFKVMFIEEYRENLDFAQKRRIVMFPLMLALITMVATIGLQFLVGESTAQGGEIDSKTFTWDEMRLFLHLPLMMFSLGMGSFAFLGRERILSRAGSKNYLLAAPALQPLNNSIAHLAYFTKDLLYYVILILSPVIFGMGVGISLDYFGRISTPLLWTSLFPTWLAMIITLAQGLCLSFLASSLWLRGGIWTKLTPILVIGIGTIAGLGLIPVELALWGLAVQLNTILVVPMIALAFLCAWVASKLILDDFEVTAVSRKELFEPIYARLGFLGKGTLRLLVAKEFVDLVRSGSLKKMTVSYSVPLIVLLMMAWLVDFAEAPIPINLLSYAPFLGFFGFNFYSWLTALDAPDHMNGLPLSVPQLIRAKVVVYFLATSWISISFVVLMAWKLDEFAALPVALIVMLANSIYIVSLTAFLMGLRPNKAIFDGRIMVWFWIGTVIPLLSLFLLSFTQGDTEFYQNWYSQVSQKGLDATAVEFTSEKMRIGFKGIMYVSGFLIAGSILLMKLLDRRWGRAAFNN
jgi:hypothetical protein